MGRTTLKASISSVINTNGANEIEGAEDQAIRFEVVDEVYNLADDDITSINGVPTLVIGDIGKQLTVTGVNTLGLTSDIPYTNIEIDASITNAIDTANADSVNKYFTNALRTPTNTTNVFTVDSTSEGKTVYTTLPEALIIRFTNAIGLPTTGATIVIDSLAPVDLKNQEGEQIQNIIDGVYWAIKDNQSDYRIQGVDVSGAGHTIQDAGVDLLQRANLNFIGATVTDDAGNDATIITIGSSNYLVTEFTAETSVYVNHGIGSLPLVDVIDSTGAKIIPLSEVHDLVTKNNYTVTFSQAKTGFVLTSIGSPLSSTVVLDNRVIVKTALDFGVIDSTKEYFIDGEIDMTGVSLEVPTGGINIKGYDFNISGLYSTDAAHTLFTSPVGGSGDVLFSDFYIDVQGAGSKVFDLVSTDGFRAFETLKLNYNNCISLGSLDNYRQGLEFDTGRFGGSPTLELKGAWLGGYRTSVSIVRSLNALMTDPLFKAGTGFVMQSRFLTDMNVDLPALASFIDFSDTNFPNSSTLELRDAIITRDGLFVPNDANLTPNITASNLSCSWKGNNGVPNTFVGAGAEVTTEVSTVINTIDVAEVLLGTFTTSDLQHFDSPSNGQLRHLGTNPREYKINFDFIIDGTAAAEYTLLLIKDVAAVESTEFTQRRVINSLQGGRNVAYFGGSVSIILNKDEFLFWKIENNTNTDNVQVENTSSWSIEER